MAVATPSGAFTNSVLSEERFSELIRESYRKVFEVALKLAHNRQDAEDLTQEACFRAYRGFDRFEGDRPFANWMYRIVTRLYLDQKRYQRRRPIEVPLDSQVRHDGDGFLQFDPVDTSPSPEQQFLDSMIDQGLLDALNELSEEQRELVEKVDLEGVECQAIADAGSIPHSTVRSRLHRAHRQMQAQLVGRYNWSLQ